MKKIIMWIVQNADPLFLRQKESSDQNRSAHNFKLIAKKNPNAWLPTCLGWDDAAHHSTQSNTRWSSPTNEWHQTRNRRMIIPCHCPFSPTRHAQIMQKEEGKKELRNIHSACMQNGCCFPQRNITHTEVRQQQVESKCSLTSSTETGIGWMERFLVKSSHVWPKEDKKKDCSQVKRMERKGNDCLGKEWNQKRVPKSEWRWHAVSQFPAWRCARTHGVAPGLKMQIFLCSKHTEFTIFHTWLEKF